MRLRFSAAVLLAFSAAACSDDDGVSSNARPPLGGVRFINAVADGGPVDIRMVDQVEWSASSVNSNSSGQYGLPFRSGTIHWATEAKARHIRVFPTDSNITVTSTVLLDVTVPVEANKNVTLMLVGSCPDRTPPIDNCNLTFVTIDDTPPALTGGQIAVRVVNASSTGSVPGPLNGYITATTTSALPGTPTFANVAPLSASPYIVRDTASFAAQATPTTGATPLITASAPAGAPAADGIAATAGAKGPGSALSA